ncbi:MAG: hypothetical protein ACE5F1_00890 [Planctomycetota bacterium]
MKAEALTRLRRRSREKLKKLAADLGSYQFKGALGGLLASLQAEHFLILATLLRRHLRSVSPFMEGRALLSSVFDTSFELLQGLELIQPDSYLREHDLIVAEHTEEQEAELLECRFRLSDSAVEAFLEETGVRAKARPKQAIGYHNQREYLVELKLLHNLYLARARRMFSAESWWRLRGAEADRAGRALDRRIRRFERGIAARLERSEDVAEFPIRRFIIEMGLSKSEVVIVLHLLFLEMLEGNPYADTVALIQLVSSSEEELLANRALFAPGASLRRRDIVDLEQMIEDREMTSECRLNNWVVERILGDEGRSPISADEKLNFHLYLKKLGSSQFLNDF